MLGDYSWDDQDPDEMQSSLEFAGPEDADYDDEDAEYCECGSECQVTSDGTCGCDKCDFCQDCYAICSCETCNDCKQLNENCDCEHCEACAESLNHCDCLKCMRCQELPAECLCENCDCPVCRLRRFVAETTNHLDKKSPHSAVFSRVGALWTQEEDHFLAAEYLRRTNISAIASETSRTETAILSRLNLICFPKPEKDLENLFDYVPRPWTPFEIQALSNNYSSGSPLAPLASQMQRPMWELKNYLIENFIAKPIGLEDIKYGVEKSATSSSRRWTPEDLRLLTELFTASTSIEDIAAALKRTVGSVISKLLRRNLLDEVDIDLAIKQASSRYKRVNLT